MNCYCCTYRRGQGILSRFFSSSSAGGVGVKNDETLKQSAIRFWFIMHLGSACLAAVSYLGRKIHTVEEWQSWISLPKLWILKLFKQYVISLTTQQLENTSTGKQHLDKRSEMSYNRLEDFVFEDRLKNQKVCLRTLRCSRLLELQKLSFDLT